MQGACGIILETEDPSVVIKRIYKKRGPTRRLRSYRARDQYRLQTWAESVTAKYKVLYVPKPSDPEENQYKMKRIDVSTRIEMSDIDSVPDLRRELQQFYRKGRSLGIYPQDFELYKQPDGRVAMVDFDKFGIWNTDGSVEFPWGLRWTASQVKERTTI